MMGMAPRLRFALSFLAASTVAAPLLGVLFANMDSLKEAWISGSGAVGLAFHLWLTASATGFVFSVVWAILKRKEL